MPAGCEASQAGFASTTPFTHWGAGGGLAADAPASWTYAQVGSSFLKRAETAAAAAVCLGLGRQVGAGCREGRDPGRGSDHGGREHNADWNSSHGGKRRTATPKVLLRVNDDRRAADRGGEELLQRRVRDANAAVRNRMADRPRRVRAVDPDRASLPPPRENVREGRDAERGRAAGGAGTGVPDPLHE